jgi:AraC-like DNA-binding protein
MDARFAPPVVAYRLGYREVDKFTRAFKYSHGMTPVEYRRRFANTPPRQLRVGKTASQGIPLAVVFV